MNGMRDGFCCQSSVDTVTIAIVILKAGTPYPITAQKV